MILNAKVHIELAKSTNYIPMGFWNSESDYYLSDIGIPFVKKTDSSTLGYSVYALIVQQATKGSWVSSEWRLLESAEFIYMQDAYIERLQAALVTAEKIESLMIRTNNIEILEGAIVKGTLDSVTGSFKRLNCIDENGNVIGSIKFGSDGRIWFENCSIAHQAASGPFLTSDVWVRGVLGVRERTVLEVKGSYGYIYKTGLSKSSEYITFTSAQDSGGNTYYKLPLYSPSEASAGAPIDIVIINTTNTNTYNYEMNNIAGKTVTLINSHDEHSDIYIYCNGIRRQVVGGHGMTLVCIGSHQTPDSSTWLGRGWHITGVYDNTWH